MLFCDGTSLRSLVEFSLVCSSSMCRQGCSRPSVRFCLSLSSLPLHMPFLKYVQASGLNITRWPSDVCFVSLPYKIHGYWLTHSVTKYTVIGFCQRLFFGCRIVYSMSQLELLDMYKKKFICNFFPTTYVQLITRNSLGGCCGCNFILGVIDFLKGGTRDLYPMSSSDVRNCSIGG